MAIAKVRKPPRRPVVNMTQGGGGQRRMAAGPVPKVQSRRPTAQPTFQPTKVNFPKSLPTPKRPNPASWYRTQPGQMPVEFDPNANLDTVQGNINAGKIQWTPGLGKIGYTPPARAPTGIDIPGFGGGDLMSGVLGDWEYGAAVGDIEAANRADEVAAGENINALAVGWGGDLSGLVQQGLIDSKAAEAAKANQFSTMANLQRSLEQGQGRAQAQLAARGILSSGALPGAETELNRQFQQETQTGLQELMGQIRGVRSSQAQARAGRQSDLAGVRANVAGRLSQLEAYQPIPKMQAFWDPQVQSYVDDWGRRFNRQGQRLS